MILGPAAGSLGDATECFHLITTGARTVDEVRQAEDADELIVQAMAFIAEQTEKIRMEAESTTLGIVDRREGEGGGAAMPQDEETYAAGVLAEDHC